MIACSWFYYASPRYELSIKIMFHSLIIHLMPEHAARYTGRIQPWVEGSILARDDLPKPQVYCYHHLGITTLESLEPNLVYEVVVSIGMPKGASKRNGARISRMKITALSGCPRIVAKVGPSMSQQLFHKLS